MTGRARPPRRAAGGEAAFQAQVLGIARLYGWRAYHTHDSRRSQPGFPDLVLARPPRLIFAELKTDAGRVRPEQREWLDDLAGVPGVEVHLWRPAQLHEIAGVLVRGQTTIDPSIGPHHPPLRQ